MTEHNDPRHRAASAAEIRAARAALGLTARELAHLLDVNERTVRRWEKGHGNPSPGVSAELRALDARADELAAAIAVHARCVGQPFNLDGPTVGTAKRATPGLIAVAAWRAHLRHGTPLTHDAQ